jgi:hypothetical protein
MFGYEESGKEILENSNSFFSKVDEISIYNRSNISKLFKNILSNILD